MLTKGRAEGKETGGRERWVELVSFTLQSPAFYAWVVYFLSATGLAFTPDNSMLSGVKAKVPSTQSVKIRQSTVRLLVHRFSSTRAGDLRLRLSFESEWTLTRFYDWVWVLYEDAHAGGWHTLCWDVTMTTCSTMIMWQPPRVLKSRHSVLDLSFWIYFTKSPQRKTARYVIPLIDSWQLHTKIPACSRKKAPCTLVRVML